jgi:hypothetical protein
MNIYIQKDTTTIYVELDFLLDENSYEIGTTWEDYKNGKWVLLSEEQVAFREENPDASAEEVFNMELNPEPPGPTPEELLKQAKNNKIAELGRLHSSKLREFKYNNNPIYMDYYQRLIKKDEANIAKKSGDSSILLGDVSVDVDSVEYVVDAITVYEQQCNVSFTGKMSQIDSCESVEEVETIVVDDSYPEPTELTQEDILSSEAIATANVPEMQLMSFAKMAVNTMSLTDEQALSVKLLHPEWKEFIGGSLSVGERAMYDDKLYKVKQEINPVLENQPPSIETAALYEEINEKHAGTKEDPIPFNNNMELELGKYYSQNGVTYMCFRDSQQPVYQNLADLVGIYVQIAE